MSQSFFDAAERGECGPLHLRLSGLVGEAQGAHGEIPAGLQIPARALEIGERHQCLSLLQSIVNLFFHGQATLQVGRRLLQAASRQFQAPEIVSRERNLEFAVKLFGNVQAFQQRLGRERRLAGEHLDFPKICQALGLQVRVCQFSG
jgi:hypothetical protein